MSPPSHHATTINIKGDSYRLKEKRRAGLLTTPRADLPPSPRANAHRSWTPSEHDAPGSRIRDDLDPGRYRPPPLPRPRTLSPPTQGGDFQMPPPREFRMTTDNGEVGRMAALDGLAQVRGEIDGLVHRQPP